jgi:hypothetical protein
MPGSARSWCTLRLRVPVGTAESETNRDDDSKDGREPLTIRQGRHYKTRIGAGAHDVRVSAPVLIV